MASMVANVNENECKEFEVLLINLQDGDNHVRSNAEAAYQQVAPEKKVVLLFSAIASARQDYDAIPSFAAVLLRRLFSTQFEESVGKLSPEMKTSIQNQLLMTIQQDIPNTLRRKICDATAELARKFIDDDGNNLWPDFLKFLFDGASSQNHHLKEASLLMFASVPGVFGNLQHRYLDVIKQMLMQCLADNTTEVRHAAVKALSAFICAHESEMNIYKNFVDCLPLLLQELLNASEKNDEDTVEMLLKHIVDMAEICPNFFRGQIDNLFQLCFKIMVNSTTSLDCRHIALEVVATIADSAPAMVRKLGLKTVAQIVPFLVLKMMVELEDEEDWSFVEDNADEDNTSDAVVGESSLDRFACSLGGKTVLPLVMTCVSEMLKSPNWKHRHAGLMAISAVGEGCNKQLEPMLHEVINAILPFLTDPHCRVRYATCNALGQMATDFAPHFAKKFHDKVLPGLLQLMSNDESPRVQAHAGAALVNFFEECPKSIVTSYLPQVAEKLSTVLQSKFTELVEKGTKSVLEQVVVTISSVADAAGDQFNVYYDQFMPCLKYIIQNAKTAELRLLRGKTIECVSLIGLAVGQEKFVPDASDVMNLLLESQTDSSTITDDDPQLAYMISAWARICKILGKSFEPYLVYVMGPVMKTAGLKPEIALLDSDDLKVVEDDDNWQFISLGEQNFGIKTSGLEEKATACEMLVCYARELKEAFSPYVEDVVKLMVPMLKFYFHEGVRTAAGDSMPYLLESAKVRGEAYVRDMWRFILPELLQAIESEPEREVLAEFMHSFAQCVEIMGNQSLNPENMTVLMNTLDARLQQYFERARKRMETRTDEDYDEVLEEDLLEQDDEDTYLLSKIADILHALFASYKDEFYPFFDLLLQDLLRLVQPDSAWTDKQWGLCIFDDVIEFGGPACSKYQEQFLQPLLSGLIAESSEVRQASSYGCGVLAQFGGPTFAKICADSVPFLAEMINAPNSRSVENINATENAISAVTKIIHHNNSCINMEEVIPMWTTWLPVWEDTEEAPHVYNLLCSLMEQNHVALLGNDNCNLPVIVRILAEAFAKSAIDLKSEVGKRVLAIIAYIQSNSDVFVACISQLSPDQQQALHAAISTQ